MRRDDRRPPRRERRPHRPALRQKTGPARVEVPEVVPVPFDVVVNDRGEAEIHQSVQHQSMVVRNPSIQRETHVMQPKDDPFLKTLNAGEEYSMLRCPGKWTLAVKEYYRRVGGGE